MIFEVLVCPCGAAPECPFDQSYDSALTMSLTPRSYDGREGTKLTMQRLCGCG